MLKLSFVARSLIKIFPNPVMLSAANSKVLFEFRTFSETIARMNMQSAHARAFSRRTPPPFYKSK